MKKVSNQVNIQVGASSRPIKVAYIVPTDENQNTHWILDSIFYESYTRWGGASSLIIPSDKDRFQEKNYEDWLEFFDPDFVYSYVDLENEVIQKIDELCSPISFISHKAREITRWRSYMPDWHHYFQAVPSLSTLLSPYSHYSRYRTAESEQKRVLVTQYCDPSEERFLADNFGISHDVNNYTNPEPGLYETLCFVGKSDKGSIRAGSEETANVVDVLKRIVDGNVTTFSQLARIHAKGISRVDHYFWSSSFSLIIGKSCLDRIHFWNSRNLASTWSDIPGALIIDKETFNNEDFVRSLGTYLNKYN